MRYRDAFKGLHEYASGLPAFSDHEHHQTDAFFAEGMSLDKAMANAYVAWTGHAPHGTPESRADVLEHVRFNSYYEWFERGVQQIQGLEGPLTLDNWDAVSERIAAAYAADPDFHWRALTDHGYERLIQDSYWNPGSDEGHPEVFTPTFRIDKFMYGHHAEAEAPNEIVPWRHYGFEGGGLDDYVELMRETIRAQHAEGKVAALKCAEAYNRSISLLPDDAEAARAAFGIAPDAIAREQFILFSNYIFNRACELAGRLDVPFQVHTGLALLSGSQPMNLEPIIARYPQVRFVLFHSGFPWTHQVAGLAHNYGNVLPSLTWTATICTSAAVRALHDYIDVANSINGITWGSDCWVAEDSIGALLAWRFIVATVLARRVADGRLASADAELLTRKFMHENGRRVYGVGPRHVRTG